MKLRESLVPCSFRHGYLRSRSADKRTRNVQCKGASYPWLAAQLDFAAEQACEFPADGQAQAGAAIFTTGAGVGLLKGFKDDALLLLRDTDSGIGDFEGNDGAGTAKDRVPFTPA